MYGDFILAYNDGILVGSRQWNGGIIDVPVMGMDGNESTQGYCNVGDVPVFKVVTAANGNSISILSSYPSWSPNATYMIDNIYQNESVNIPESLELISIYPNPFNPETTINFSNPIDQHIKINIYNVLGKYIGNIYDNQIASGKHSFKWNAQDYSSGVYFIKIISNNEIATQKVVLIK